MYKNKLFRKVPTLSSITVLIPPTNKPFLPKKAYIKKYDISIFLII